MKERAVYSNATPFINNVLSMEISHSQLTQYHLFQFRIMLVPSFDHEFPLKILDQKMTPKHLKLKLKFFNLYDNMKSRDGMMDFNTRLINDLK